MTKKPYGEKSQELRFGYEEKKEQIFQVGFLLPAAGDSENVFFVGGSSVFDRKELLLLLPLAVVGEVEKQWLAEEWGPCKEANGDR